MKITKRAAATTSAFAGLALVLGGSTFAVASGFNPFPAEEPAAVVETVDFVGSSTVNGLAAEEETEAAAAVAAQAEADRVAAEAAAAAEANRIAAEQAAAAVEAQGAAPDQSADAPDAPSGPTYCPAGTIAGAVDGNGNEYNCAATGGSTGEQMCVAYNDANECTAWLEQ